MRIKIKNKDKDENIRKKLRASNIDKTDTIEQSIEEVRSLKKERLKYIEMRKACSIQYEYIDQIYYDGEIDKDNRDDIMDKIEVNKERFENLIESYDLLIETSEDILKSLTGSNSLTGKIKDNGKVSKK
jgi:hypothetical protein